MSRKRCNDGKGQSPSGDGEGERKTARSFRGSMRAVLGMEAVTTRPFVGLEPSDILAPPSAVLAASLRQVAKLAPVHASREQSWRECSRSERKGSKTKTTRLGAGLEPSDILGFALRKAPWGFHLFLPSVGAACHGTSAVGEKEPTKNRPLLRSAFC